MAVRHSVRVDKSSGSRVLGSEAVAPCPNEATTAPSAAVCPDARAARIASAAAHFGAAAVKSVDTTIYRHHPELLYCSTAPVRQLQSQLRDLEAQGQPVGARLVQSSLVRDVRFSVCETFICEVLPQLNFICEVAEFRIAYVRFAARTGGTSSCR